MTVRGTAGDYFWHDRRIRDVQFRPLHPRSDHLWIFSQDRRHYQHFRGELDLNRTKHSRVPVSSTPPSGLTRSQNNILWEADCRAKSPCSFLIFSACSTALDCSALGYLVSVPFGDHRRASRNELNFGPRRGRTQLVLFLHQNSGLELHVVCL